nr:hypothetical protein [Tanacetum cinerariifolium]
MTSFGYRLNPRFAIKECSSCGALYTGDFCCSKGNVEDKILVPKPPKNRARCAKCGHPVNGPHCQGCALLREKLEEDLVTYLKYFQDTSESSDESTNIVNAPREPVVVKQDHGINPPHIDKCCCECGNALDGIFCQQCICKSCGKGDHIGYNCPPIVPIISNPEPSKPGLQCMTSGQISSGLDLTYAPSTITKQQPTEGELDLLFEAMYDDYFCGQPSATMENVPPAQEPQVRQTSTASTTIADNVPIPTN